MAIRLSSLRADTRRETDGDWVEIPDLPGVRLKVRGAGYGPYQMQKSIVEGRWIRRYGQDPVPVDVNLAENGKLYASHILLDWDGFDEPYSQEAALHYLTDPGFRMLHDHIRYAMARVSATETEFVEDATKNSSRSSDGSSTAAAQ
jgi:hypothetical protein